MSNQITAFEFAFAGVSLIAGLMHTNRRIYRRRSTYQLLTRLDEVIEAMLDDDLAASKPWSPVLIESATAEQQRNGDTL